MAVLESTRGSASGQEGEGPVGGPGEELLQLRLREELMVCQALESYSSDITDKMLCPVPALVGSVSSPLVDILIWCSSKFTYSCGTRAEVYHGSHRIEL